MYICYLDESGTETLGAGTSHFVYLGLAIPAETWKTKDAAISGVADRYGLRGREIHTGWIARRYVEQERVEGFAAMDYTARRAAALAGRQQWLIRTAALKSKDQLDSLKRTLRKTEPYLHLTRAERQQLLRDLSDVVGAWADARLFAEAIDKTSFRGAAPSLYEQAFQQMVARFQAFLSHRGDFVHEDIYGMLVHDNNQTMALKLTELMRTFHARGTFHWTITRVVETPLFVDSQLTGMVQMADLCAYATRRFFEHADTDLFDRIYSRFDRTGTRLVGLRHFQQTANACTCRVCRAHH